MSDRGVDRWLCFPISVRALAFASAPMTALTLPMANCRRQTTNDRQPRRM